MCKYVTNATTTDQHYTLGTLYISFDIVQIMASCSQYYRSNLLIWYFIRFRKG